MPTDVPLAPHLLHARASRRPGHIGIQAARPRTGTTNVVNMIYCIASVINRPSCLTRQALARGRPTSNRVGAAAQYPRRGAESLRQPYPKPDSERRELLSTCKCLEDHRAQTGPVRGHSLGTGGSGWRMQLAVHSCKSHTLVLGSSVWDGVVWKAWGAEGGDHEQQDSLHVPGGEYVTGNGCLTGSCSAHFQGGGGVLG